MNSPTDDLDSDSLQCRAALERLAAALSPRDFATTLVTGNGRAARLTVASRHTPLSEEISAARHAYRWSWAEPIAPLVMHDVTIRTPDAVLTPPAGKGS